MSNIKELKFYLFFCPPTLTNRTVENFFCPVFFLDLDLYYETYSYKLKQLASNDDGYMV